MYAHVVVCVWCVVVCIVVCVWCMQWCAVVSVIVCVMMCVVVCSGVQWCIVVCRMLFLGFNKEANLHDEKKLARHLFVF